MTLSTPRWAICHGGNQKTAFTSDHGELATATVALRAGWNIMQPLEKMGVSAARCRGEHLESNLNRGNKKNHVSPGV